MGSNDTSRTIFDLRIVSIAVVIALIVGAGAGYMVGNSPVSSLMEERDQLEAECDSLYLAVQSLAAELDSTQELLVEEQRDVALLEQRYMEMLVIDKENQVLKQDVMDLEEQNEIQSEAIQSYISAIEALENEIDELNRQLDSSQTTRTITIDLIGTCTSVIDGDTFELSSGKRVRLADIDAPESYESGYYISTNALSSWIQGETVYLDIDDIFGTDLYGRYVCVIYVEYGAGYANVNLALLTGGYAVSDDYPNEFDPSDWGTPGNLDLSEASIDTSSPEPEPEPEPEGIYVGSINSDKYHYPSCYWAQQIKPENEIWFTSKSDAESHGYVPCKVCEP